jgi:hypothetical protein
MLQELRELGYFWLNLMGYVPIFMITPCVLWIFVSHWHVYRRGGVVGLVRWHHNNVRLGFNDAKNSLAILGLGLLSLIFCIPTAYDPLTGFCTLLSAVFFLMMAAFVGERRKHWQMLKASAIEVILAHSPPNHSR